MDKRDSIFLNNGIAWGRVYPDEDSEDYIEFKGLEVPRDITPYEVKYMIIDAAYEEMDKDRRKKIRLEMSKAYRAKLAAVGQA
jgi:hypothetical protein